MIGATRVPRLPVALYFSGAGVRRLENRTGRLSALANTTRIHAVMRRGRLIEAAALHSMLDGVRTEVDKNGAGTGR